MFRVWNPYRSKLGASVLNGIKKIPVAPGMKVLYLGAASGTTVSHVSDIVGPVTFVVRLILSRKSIHVLRGHSKVLPQEKRKKRLANKSNRHLLLQASPWRFLEKTQQYQNFSNVFR
eukprot:UN26248